MTDIDQKLRDKLKMFGEIDKIARNTSRNTNTINSNKTYHRTDSKKEKNQVELVDDNDSQVGTNFQSKKEGAANIYKSDSNNKLVSYSTAVNNPLSYDGGTGTIEKQLVNNYNNSQGHLNNTVISQDEKKDEVNMNKNKSKGQIKVASSKFITSSKNQVNTKQVNNTNLKIASNNKFGGKVGDRLYQNSVLVRQKLENKRKNEEIARKENMTPDITNKARSIVRDPSAFGERLYPRHKVGDNKASLDSSILSGKSSYYKKSQNASINNDVDSFFMENEEVERIYGNDSFINIYRKPQKSFDHFSFQPALTRKSMKIAEKLEAPMIRLTKKRKKQKSDNNINQNLSKYLNKNYSKSNLSISSANNSVSSAALPRTKEMYEKGVEQLKKRQFDYEEKIRLEEEEYFKECTFQPNLSMSKNRPEFGRLASLDGENTIIHNKKKSSSLIDYINNKDRSFYNKNAIWKKSIESKNENKKYHKEKQIIEKCTFVPNIDTSIPNPDINFIKKNADQIFNYINKRRAVLQKKNEEKEYIKKKFATGENYVFKQTIPKEFQFNKSSSRKSILTKNDAKNIYTPEKILEARKKLGLEKFFDGDDEEACNILFNKNNYAANKIFSPTLNIEEDSKVLLKTNKKTGLKTPEDELAFISAVNNLNKKMLSLKFK